MRGLSPRSARIVALLVSLTVAAGAAGCGSNGSGKSPADAGSTSTAADAQSLSTTLAPKQYAELERLYEAQVPLDRLTEQTNPAALRRLSSGVVRSCRQVDDSDPLLAAMVNGCERIVEGLTTLADSDCSTEQECARLMEETTALLRDLVDTARENQSVVEREVSDPGCRDALVQPEQIAVFEDVIHASERYSAAVDSQDLETLEAATTEMERVTKAMDEALTAKEQLTQFRSACRPTNG